MVDGGEPWGVIPNDKPALGRDTGVMNIWRILRIVAAAAAMAVLATACNSSGSIEIADVAPVAEESAVTATETSPEPSPALEDPDQSENDAEAADPAPAEAPERTSEQQPAPATSRKPITPVETLRDIDFENGFTYETLLEFGEPFATVQDGYFENGTWGDEDFYSFSARSTAYGDLDGDGIEEVALATSWNGGGTGHFDSVRVYRLTNGQPERAGIVPFGDRADGGVHRVRIVDGTVRVWYFADGQGACCPTHLAEATLLLGPHSLVDATRGEARTWEVPASNEAPIELKFAPGTSSAYLSVYGSTMQGLVTFEAQAGQLFETRLLEGPEPAIVLTDQTTGSVLDPWRTELPSTGVYELSTGFPTEAEATAELEVRIGATEQRAEAMWTTGVDQVLLSDEPRVLSSVTWPVFADAGVTAVAEQFATGLDDYWVEAIESGLDVPQGESTYDASFTVSLATPDLVSIDFIYYEYVCCRPYPNYGSRGLVIDRASGLVPVEELLDLTRADEIFTLWHQQLTADEDFVPGYDFVNEFGAMASALDAVTLTPDGVEFGTDRNELGGGTIPTVTLLTWDQLGDLVDPSIAARAQQ